MGTCNPTLAAKTKTRRGWGTRTFFPFSELAVRRGGRVMASWRVSGMVGERTVVLSHIYGAHSVLLKLTSLLEGFGRDGF